MTTPLSTFRSSALRAGCFTATLAGLTACDTATRTLSPYVEGKAHADSTVVLAEPTVSAEIAPGPVPAPRLPGPRPRRGVVTAGDIDDTLNLAAFLRYQKAAAAKLRLPSADLRGAIRAEVVNARYKPAAGVRVTLTKRGSFDPFFDGYSGVDGRVDVYPAEWGAGYPKEVVMKAFFRGDVMATSMVTPDERYRNVVHARFAPDYEPDFLDLAFVIDTTGSMGDEIAWLTREFEGLVRKAKLTAPKANMRFALVAYRDRGDQYVVRNFGFTHNTRQMQAWLSSLNAGGGGDYPEAADQAMAAAAGLTWRRGKGERLLFHIADAPAHNSGAGKYLAASRKLAQKQVQIFGLGASGVGPEAEFLMRQAAVQTQGRYLFLTDDSGVGNPHAEPSIPCYRVSKLKTLLNRVLMSELTGKRQEVPAQRVIRTVGSYRGGVCRQ
jgi:hypothetical protein